MKEINQKQYEDIAHSLGVNLYHAKNSKMFKHKVLPSEFYRNYYCAGKSKIESFEDLVNQDICDSYIKFENIIYYITDLGITLFREYLKNTITDNYVKPSRSKRAYLDYIDADYCDSFSDYLGIVPPKIEYLHDEYRFKSMKYSGVNGSFCKTRKLAKASYKTALFSHLKNISYGRE